MTLARVVLVIIDGLGDVSVPSLGDETPLQAAATPCLDALAAAGVSGLLDPVSPGVACGSDTAHLSLLGYDPVGAARGRGAFEALGAGLDLRSGDVAFKCNFAVVDDASRVVTSRRADRRFEEDGRALLSRSAARLPRLSARSRQRSYVPRWTGCACRAVSPARATRLFSARTRRSTERASSCVGRGCATASPAQARRRRAPRTRRRRRVPFRSASRSLQTR